MINSNVACFELLECFTKVWMTALVGFNLTRNSSKEIATIFEELIPCLKG